jgi:PHD/YefM family antitoxin component YafN of YafNO toxin-antitoxin module
MELLGGMAKAINKPVLITGENEPEQVLITIQAS